MTALLDELAYPSTIRPGPEWHIEAGAIQTHYVDADEGEPIRVLVVGTLSEIVQMDDPHDKVLVLGSPSATMPSSKQHHTKQADLLRHILVEERSNNSRAIIETQSWNANDNILVRIDEFTKLETIDVRTATIELNCQNIADEAPIDIPTADPICKDSLVICLVDPFKVDFPITDGSKLYRRMYGLQAAHVAKAIRTV